MSCRAAIALGLVATAAGLMVSSDGQTAQRSAACLVARQDTVPASVAFRHGRRYNLRCPRGYSKSDIHAAANEFAKGSKPAAGSNPIPGDYAPYGLMPYAKQITSYGVYPKYAIGIVDFWTAASSSTIAKFCKQVNQAGVVALGQRLDREYKCQVHIFADERQHARAAAKLLVERDLLAQARKANLRMCLLESTDIQCAPCTTSNKLVVRVHSVRKGAMCPGGSISYVE
jgi:hypothetical protein